MTDAKGIRRPPFGLKDAEGKAPWVEFAGDRPEALLVEPDMNASGVYCQHLKHGEPFPAPRDGAQIPSSEVWRHLSAGPLTDKGPKQGVDHPLDHCRERLIAERPNGPRLSCGRNARGRKAVEPQTKRLASEATQFLPTCERPAASSAC